MRVNYTDKVHRLLFKDKNIIIEDEDGKMLMIIERSSKTDTVNPFRIDGKNTK